MSSADVLLRAYYELLYERMEAKRDRLVVRIDELLRAEIERQGYDGVDGDKYEAYRDACLAFVDERAESYNPIGIQYTFGRVRSRDVAELEFQLNWYNSRAEFGELVAAARTLAERGTSDTTLPDLADKLISRAGAFPDRSIIGAYLAEPALQKLPDYIVACCVEELVCGRRPSR